MANRLITSLSTNGPNGQMGYSQPILSSKLKDVFCRIIAKGNDASGVTVIIYSSDGPSKDPIQYVEIGIIEEEGLIEKVKKTDILNSSILYTEYIIIGFQVTGVGNYQVQIELWGDEEVFGIPSDKNDSVFDTDSMEFA